MDKRYARGRFLAAGSMDVGWLPVVNTCHVVFSEPVFDLFSPIVCLDILVAIIPQRRVSVGISEYDVALLTWPLLW